MRGGHFGEQSGLFSAFALLADLLIAQSAGLRSRSTASSSPPATPARPVIDDYCGNKVVDPYRYRENLKDPEVQAWMKAQDDYTRAVLARIWSVSPLAAFLPSRFDSSEPTSFGPPWYGANRPRFVTSAPPGWP